MPHIPNPKELRLFGLCFGLVPAIIGIRLLLKYGLFEIFYGCIALAAIIELLALVRPVLLRPLNTFMGALLRGLVWITTRTVLVIAFYLVVTPTGIVLKLCGKDLLDKRIDKKTATYWKTRETKIFIANHFEKQY